MYYRKNVLCLKKSAIFLRGRTRHSATFFNRFVAGMINSIPRFRRVKLAGIFRLFSRLFRDHLRDDFRVLQRTNSSRRRRVNAKVTHVTTSEVRR